MKSSKLIMGCLATLGLAASAASVQAEVDRDAIAERLQPVGELCLQGDECGTAVAAASDSGGEGADGEGLYNQVCSACHDSGAAGAPVRGEEDAWADRVGKGWDELLSNAINGIGAMPAKGGNANLSDEEMAVAVAYMLEPVMDVPDVGGDEAADGGDEAVTEEGPVEEEAAAATEDAPVDEEASADEQAAGDEPAHAGIDGEAVYNQACMACHMTGAAGAPMRGDEEQWAERIDQDIETLYDHAINGIGAMPPKGGNTGLSDDEVRAAVDFLVEPVK